VERKQQTRRKIQLGGLIMRAGSPTSRRTSRWAFSPLGRARRRTARAIRASRAAAFAAGERCS
jgi:hypothetical protein